MFKKKNPASRNGPQGENPVSSATAGSKSLFSPNLQTPIPTIDFGFQRFMPSAPQADAPTKPDYLSEQWSSPSLPEGLQGLPPMPGGLDVHHEDPQGITAAPESNFTPPAWENTATLPMPESPVPFTSDPMADLYPASGAQGNAMPFDFSETATTAPMPAPESFPQDYFAPGAPPVPPTDWNSEPTWEQPATSEFAPATDFPPHTIAPELQAMESFSSATPQAELNWSATPASVPDYGEESLTAPPSSMEWGLDPADDIISAPGFESGTFEATYASSYEVPPYDAPLPFADGAPQTDIVDPAVANERLEAWESGILEPILPFPAPPVDIPYTVAPEAAYSSETPASHEEDFQTSLPESESPDLESLLQSLNTGTEPVADDFWNHASPGFEEFSTPDSPSVVVPEAPSQFPDSIYEQLYPTDSILPEQSTLAPQEAPTDAVANDDFHFSLEPPSESITFKEEALPAQLKGISDDWERETNVGTVSYEPPASATPASEQYAFNPAWEVPQPSKAFPQSDVLEAYQSYGVPNNSEPTFIQELDPPPPSLSREESAPQTQPLPPEGDIPFLSFEETFGPGLDNSAPAFSQSFASPSLETPGLDIENVSLSPAMDEPPPISWERESISNAPARNDEAETLALSWGSAPTEPPAFSEPDLGPPDLSTEFILGGLYPQEDSLAASSAPTLTNWDEVSAPSATAYSPDLELPDTASTPEEPAYDPLSLSWESGSEAPPSLKEWMSEPSAPASVEPASVSFEGADTLSFVDPLSAPWPEGPDDTPGFDLSPPGLGPSLDTMQSAPVSPEPPAWNAPPLGGHPDELAPPIQALDPDAFGMSQPSLSEPDFSTVVPPVMPPPDPQNWEALADDMAPGFTDEWLQPIPAPPPVNAASQMPQNWRLEDLEVRDNCQLSADKALFLVEMEGMFALMGLVGENISVVKFFERNPSQGNAPLMASKEGSAAGREMYLARVGTWQAVLAADNQAITLHTELSA